MTYVWLAFQLLRGLLPGVISLAARLPYWVWIAGAVVVVVLIYGHSVATKTAAQKDFEYAVKTQKEILRQQEVADAAIKQEKDAALEAQLRVEGLNRSLADAKQEMQQWKDRARVCVPADVVNKLRHDTKGRSRSKTTRTPLRLAPVR